MVTTGGATLTPCRDQRADGEWELFWEVIILYEVTSNQIPVTRKTFCSATRPGGTHNVLSHEALAVGGRGPVAHNRSFLIPGQGQLEVPRGVGH